jgi:predicted aspartyl protease
VDTGAFKTVIPANLVASLGLLQVRELPVEGLGGTPVLLPTFLIEIAIDGLATITVEVLASPGEPVVLLGRDVLNRYEISLNGPALILTISEP